ncbi:hypothetical protein DEW08_10235 [Azospirillum thermophilum]|uniref:Uncharacterized protein n=1 Tax=Azospirillum thermophilum TaxID=2202148 RepID=A0A2S2CQH4_9PROT|nr:hypothetical protein DEW08_10235 [Azospirillum thermophilum]
MIRRRPGIRSVSAATPLHSANRFANRAGGLHGELQFAKPLETSRHLEEACARLQEAAAELESALPAVPDAGGRADLTEAIGSIMETMRMISAAHSHLGPQGAD